MQLSKNSQKVQDYLNTFGLTLEVVELAESTRTAQEAASAAGCEVGQIVKSLVFRSGEEALLFLVSGRNQLDTHKVSQAIGKPITKADADFAKEKTGYAIGGVPPVAHATQIEIFIDKDLLGYEEVWAAAGTPHAVFRLKSNDLPRLTGGKVIEVC
ncbi:MAG: YbaK/EbsC family protein [Pelolinea sp.]|nr:YbaK/EbsC family protein [Pelolinea sp.]